MRNLIFLLFMASALPMAIMEPYIGLLLWVLLSDMNPYREVWGFSSHFHWVLITAIITLFSMLIHRGSVRRLHWTALSVSMLLFAILTSISTFHAVVPSYAMPHWIQFLKVLVVAYVIIMLVYTPERVHWLIWTFVVSFGFWSAKGGVFTLLHGGNYHVFGPTQSFFHDNNQFALVMCMALPLMRYLQIHAKSRWVGIGLLALMVLTIASIFGTYSRGGLIALGVVLLALILKSRRRFGLLLAVAIIVPFALQNLPSKWTQRMTGLTSGTAVEGASFQGRVDSWDFATNFALHHPLVGGGFGVWASQEMWDIYGPGRLKQGKAIHSIWFQVLAEQGFIGLGLYAAMLGFAWFDLARIRRRTRGDPRKLWLYDLAGFIQVGLVGFVVAGSALPQAYFNFTFQVYALVVCMRRLSEQKAGSESAFRVSNDSSKLINT